jgi:hypothetical protein
MQYRNYAHLPHAVSVGGGITSTWELPLEVVRRHGTDNVHFFICAINHEHDDVWRMTDQVERETGIPVHKVSWQPTQNIRMIKTLGKTTNYNVDMPPTMWKSIWDAFEHRGMMGSSLFDTCSDTLKRRTARNYIRDFFPDGCFLHLGITYEEKHRLKAISQNWRKYGVIVKGYLVQKTRNDKRTKIERAMESLGWVPEMYMQGHDHMNCDGPCVKGGKKHWKRVLWYNREAYLYHEEQELSWRERYGDYTILREMRKGVKYKITLRELRERTEKEWEGLTEPPYDDITEEYGSACMACNAVG